MERWKTQTPQQFKEHPTSRKPGLDWAQKGEILPWMCSWEFHSILFSPELQNLKVRDWSSSCPDCVLIFSKWHEWHTFHFLPCKSVICFLFKIHCPTESKPFQVLILPGVLAAASLFVCYLQGTAVPGTAGASPHSCGKSCLFPTQESQNCHFCRSDIF